MNVFGHDHVANHHPLVTLPYLFQNFDKEVAATGAGEQWLPAVTTKCQEVQVVPAVPALQAPRHGNRVEVTIASAL